MEKENRMTPERDITVTPANGYFAHLVVYLVALQGFVHSTEIYNTGSAKRWPADDVVILDAKQAQMRLTFAPLSLLTTVCLNQKPVSLRLSETTKSIELNANLNLGAIEPLLFSFGQAMVTNYFEEYRDEIEGTFTDNPAKWPPVWNFARVVRNAMSHGGHINIKNRNSLPARWRSLTYSYADNDRQVLHTDIWPGDLFYLLSEMDVARGTPALGLNTY
jgi:hypothetical protein